MATKEVAETIMKMTKTVKESNKEDKSAIGKKQVADIGEIYKTQFTDEQRYAFFLGRIYASLDIGNSLAEGINNYIKHDEETLRELVNRINGKNIPKEVKVKKRRAAANQEKSKIKKEAKND